VIVFEPEKLSDRRSYPELFFGIVGPIGVSSDAVSTALRRALEEVGYQSEEVHVIELLHVFERWKDMPRAPAKERYWKRIHAGDKFCEIMERGDALAVLSLLAIRDIREAKSGSRLTPKPKLAYILRSLKRPAEVDTLRAIYGPAFFLIAAYAPREKRVSQLADVIAQSKGNTKRHEEKASAEKLVLTDEKESDSAFGQDVRGTFSKADVFVEASNQEKLKAQLCRFVRILFGDQAYSPTRDEYAMAHAQVAANRSADLSRQVGAALTAPDGTIISVGTNEVPKAKGGQYWEDDEFDMRDRKIGRNVSYDMRLRVLSDTLRRLSKMGWIVQDKAERVDDIVELTTEALEGLTGDAEVMSTIEFGRVVHAEMAALMDAARMGVSTKGCHLYTTTFPCHGCARHIVAAGIDKVIYIHPYPKSLAQELFNDSIAVDVDRGGDNNRISFYSFVGISPERYFEFFKMLPRVTGTRQVKEWEVGEPPRMTGYPESYTVAETTEVECLEREIKRKTDRLTEKTEEVQWTSPDSTRHG